MALLTAKKLILCAKKNKADAVKFQSFNADRLALSTHQKLNTKKIQKNETHYHRLKSFN